MYLILCDVDGIMNFRYAVMAFVMLITGLLCVYRIYQLHSVKHEALHHYLIFYSSTICSILWYWSIETQLTSSSF